MTRILRAHRSGLSELAFFQSSRLHTLLNLGMTKQPFMKSALEVDSKVLQNAPKRVHFGTYLHLDRLPRSETHKIEKKCV